MQRKHNKDIVPTAKMLRKNMTKEEKHLMKKERLSLKNTD